MVTGCALFGSHKEKTTLRIYEQVNERQTEPFAMKVSVPKQHLTLSISPVPTLTEKDILTVEPYPTSGGTALLIRFDPHGLIKLEEMTTRMRGQYVVMFVNSQPVTAWLVERRLAEGQLLVEADLTDSEANQLIADLNKSATASQKNKSW